ncbi:MAG: UDP-N-acetylglucosamine--dolichyl-phosphate N-acetylglucosaminephosphotransferase [Candidatus Altiarchaeales archaeon]|nr:MAG: UDP-N-acetylglucosamine--dolichyl-phosphate N-acetylglucosaminephosphotransferase [Candidatus Altiarchaeales archaeon]
MEKNKYRFKMHALILIVLVSFIVTFISTPWIIPKLKRAGLTGRDMNKKNKPEIPEMGGFGIIFGFSSGVLLAIALSTFFNQIPELELKFIFAALSTILIMSLVGIFDDLFAMHQAIKAILPLFAALPLTAVEAGTSTMSIPFFGTINFGIFYALLLVPMGIAGASNVTNMLAGFNGLEAGMGLVACSALSFIAFKSGEIEALIVLLAMCGALLAFLFYNWYPARVLIGDIGTLSIGAVIASAVIIGNFETAGIIVILPYAIDFFIKAKNKFPSKNWWGTWSGGKLICKDKPIGLCQWIMKLTNGITEQELVLMLIFIESIFGIVAVLLFL